MPIPVRLKPMRAERVAEEVEAFLSGVSQRSFRLVDRQPELGHHRLRPRQCLRRTTAAEDNEVVGIGDDVSMERLVASSQTPMLQEPVHVDVGQQWTCDSPYAKGNFTFDRVICGWRTGLTVLDLR